MSAAIVARAAKNTPAPDSPRAARPVAEFWSSTEGAAFLDGLTRELGQCGWTARQRFGVEQADYWTARSRLERWILRWRSYGAYPLKLAWRFRRAPRDLIGVVTTNTFYAARCALAAAPRNVAIIHWVFDLYPDVLTAAGAVREGSWVEQRIHRVVRRTFDGAAANVFLGENLRRYAEAKFGPIPRSYVIPIGADGGPFRQSVPAPRPPHEHPRCRILYCGNLGRMHDVETIASAIQTGLPAGVEMEFRGNGAGFRQLEDVLRTKPADRNVKLGGHLAGADWVPAMTAADVALVTLKPEAAGLAIPSKAYSALVAGQAILAICSMASDLAQLVVQHDAGWVVSPGDVGGLVNLLHRLAASPGELLAKRTRAWRAGHEHYDQSVLAKRWAELLDQVVASSGDFKRTWK